MRRQADRARRDRVREQMFADLAGHLDVSPVPVPGDGDEYYRSVIAAFGPERMREFTGGREPDPELLRQYLAGFLRATFDEVNAGRPAG